MRPGQHTNNTGGDAGDSERAAAARAEAASAELRRVIAGNRAWDAAVKVRRAWLARVLPAQDGTGQCRRVHRQRRRAFEQIHPLADKQFGVDGARRSSGDEGSDGNRVVYLGYGRRDDLATLLDGASDKRLTLVTRAVVLAAYEAMLDGTPADTTTGGAEQHYLQYLDSPGYPLCNVEGLAAGLPPLDHETCPLIRGRCVVPTHALAHSSDVAYSNESVNGHVNADEPIVLERTR
jgi:hypothetical protein